MPTRRQRADALLENPDTLVALLKNPKSWLQQYGMLEEDVACTDGAHIALAKAEEVAAKANELADLPLIEALPRLHELADSMWPDGIEVERIPFGIAIAQRPQVPDVPILPAPPVDSGTTTGTASIRCTFGLSCKADADR
jgi:hypothetical protein